MIRTCICDDNFMAISNLENIINDLNGNIEIVGKVDKLDEVIKTIKILRPDLVFMDIDWNNDKINGLQLSDQIISIYSDIMIVYATAYENYAVDAMNGNPIVLGYLVKPHDKRKVERCLNKLLTYTQDQRICIKDKLGIYYYLLPSNIIMVEYCMKNTIIRYIDKDIYTTNSLLEIESKLSKYEYFIRSHKGYIVNRNNILQLIKFNATSMIIKFNNNKGYDALITKEKALQLGLIS